MVTIATLPDWQRMAAGTMAATVKIIAYAVREAALDRACAAASGALRLRRPAIDRADLVVTTLAGASTGAEAVVARLDRLGVACTVQEVPHEAGALAAALRTGDRPVAPRSSPPRPPPTPPTWGPRRWCGRGAVDALRHAGRSREPAVPRGDPGGTRRGRVIGLPGCARSPALNGADWVLERVICGVEVTGADIAAMGVGGLLKEIPTRPQPRDRR